MKEELTSEVRNDILNILSESQKEIISIVETHNIPLRPDGFGITYKEYAKLPSSTGSEETARTLLNKLVQDGVLEKRKVRMFGNQNPSFIYYKNGTWPE